MRIRRFADRKRSWRRASRRHSLRIERPTSLRIESLEERCLLAGTPLNVLLVSDAVTHARQICAAAETDAIAISYRANAMTPTTLVDIVASVSASHDDARIGRLAIVAHGAPAEIDLGRDDLSLATLPSQAAELGRLRCVLTADARVDLYSCSVAAGAAGKAFVDQLAAATGAAVYASDDPVGTVSGADLVWEYRTSVGGPGTEILSSQAVAAISGLCLAAPTDYEQYMLELVNLSRSDPLAEAARTGIDLNEGLPAGTISPDPMQPLAFNPLLIDAARSHSQWLLDTDNFAHEGSGGSDPGDRMADAGYAFTFPAGYAENLAVQFSTAQVDVLSAVEALEVALFVDEDYHGRGHRINLMHPVLSEVGIGVMTGEYRGMNGVMITQDFAYVGGRTFLTGVVYDDSLVLADEFYTPGEGFGGVTITATRQSDQAAFSTSTWDSGGYSLDVPGGIYLVTASGGALSGAVQVADIVVDSENVKIDFVAAAGFDNAAPTLVITSPANGATVTSESLVVSGTASDAERGDNGVASVTVNEAAAAGGTVNAAETADWAATITLVPGENTITVVAMDTLGNPSQQQITVTYDPPDTTPPPDVDAFTAEPGDGEANLTWSNPDDPDFAAVQIVRKIGSAPTTPTDGTRIYDGNGESTLDSGLTNGTTYFYTAFSRDGVPNYSTGATASATPEELVDTTAPGEVADFSAEAGNGQISLEWSNPTDADFTGVRIVRNTDGFPAGPTDGTAVYDGTGTSTTDTGLTNGTTYYYTAFSHDGMPNFSGGASASATPEAPADTTPPGEVGGFSAEPGDGRVRLSWSNPTDADFAGVRIVRKTGGHPTAPADGTIVYTGTGTTATDNGLNNGTKYYYTAFTRDGVPNYSAGAIAHATPEPSADSTPPSPSLGAVPVTAAGEPTYTFTVTYSDDVAVKWSSLDSDDVVVNGPKVAMSATLLSVDKDADGTPLTATYQINTPGGQWDSSDNGLYSVVIQPNQVCDTNSNYVLAGQIGMFKVNVPTSVLPGWQNPINALDVNGDGVLAPQDALFLANFLFFHGQRAVPVGAGADPFPVEAPPYYDVNGNGYVTVQDALLVVTALRNRPPAEAEVAGVSIGTAGSSLVVTATAVEASASLETQRLDHAIFTTDDAARPTIAPPPTQIRADTGASLQRTPLKRSLAVSSPEAPSKSPRHSALRADDPRATSPRASALVDDVFARFDEWGPADAKLWQVVTDDLIRRRRPIAQR